MTTAEMYEPTPMSVVLNDKVNTDEVPEGVMPLAGVTDIQSLADGGMNDSDIPFEGLYI